MPLLLRALSSSDSDLKLTNLNVIETLSTEAPHILVKDISSLIPLLLDLCRVDGSGRNPAVSFQVLRS